MVTTLHSEGIYWHCDDSQIGSEKYNSKKASHTSKVSQVQKLLMVQIHLCNARINSNIKFRSARELGYG